MKSYKEKTWYQGRNNPNEQKESLINDKGYRQCSG